MWRTDAEAEAPVLWVPGVKSQLIGKDPDVGKDWRQRGGQKIRWLDSITNSLEVNVSKLWEIVEDLEEPGVCAAVPGVTKSQTWQHLNNNKTWGLPIGLKFLQNHFHMTSTFINTRVKASFLAFA